MSALRDRLRCRWPLHASAPEVGERLLEAYADPGRGYHDLRHLEEVLDHAEWLLDQAGAEPRTRAAVRLAAWFHDAVYDGQPALEERSAQLAEHSLRPAGVPAELAAEVARLVRLTTEHDPAPGDAAGAILCDADLAILASAEPRYAEYVAGVRREYAHLSDEEFSAGRRRVLLALAGRDPLFGTQAGRSRWEAAARANLARELAALF